MDPRAFKSLWEGLPYFGTAIAALFAIPIAVEMVRHRVRPPQAVPIHVRHPNLRIGTSVHLLTNKYLGLMYLVFGGALLALIFGAWISCESCIGSGELVAAFVALILMVVGISAHIARRHPRMTLTPRGVRFGRDGPLCDWSQILALGQTDVLWFISRSIKSRSYVLVKLGGADRAKYRRSPSQILFLTLFGLKYDLVYRIDDLEYGSRLIDVMATNMALNETQPVHRP